MEKEFPSIGETVIVKVTKVLPYGAMAELLEYENLNGFVHVSQVASRWIKNIRNFVKENQIRAAHVLSVDRGKEQIELSLTKVSAGAQRKKIEEWKQFKRAQKLVEILASENKKSFDDTWSEVAEPLIEKFSSLTLAFQEIALAKTVPEIIPKKWAKPLLELVEKNIVVPEKIVKGTLLLSSNAPNGVELIKKALKEAQSSEKENAKIELLYTGSGKYIIKVVSFDYKIGERVMNEAAEKAIKFIEGAKGTGKFSKSE